MGKMSPVQDLNTFRPRHHRGEIATLPAPVCGVFRPRISPPESEVRRVTLRVGRVSHGSLIIHARVIIHFFTAGVHSRVFEFPEVVGRAYSPRRLQDFAPLRVGRLSALVVVRALSPRRLQDFAPLRVGRLSALVVGRAFKPPATTGILTPCG